VSVSHEISPTVANMRACRRPRQMPRSGLWLTLSGEAGKHAGDAGMKAPVMMMTCSGGVMPTALIHDRPAFALFSGPGLASWFAGSRAQMGVSNILTTDIGGTSFDVV